ncbi:10836_t:CDS:1 [Acaulospora colombiana]|uniref:10836_t:CDS:1 n=1 Tax=Acaulospora colombiana TaxID=27376 RepID=A0ACA9K1F0_9GLOM|nr:10836_t:CDS:1 [Acaulospora colombiana]
MIVETLIEGKIPVKALIDTTSKSNTISKHLFDKLESDHGLKGVVGDDLIGEEIKGLDLQFCIKRKWQSLGDTELIDFQIRKNPSFDLVLGQDWLWMREAKISFGHSPKTCVRHAKIVIDGMSIPLIDGDFNKASSTKNNLSKSTESKPGLAQEEVINIINKILSNIEDRLEGSLFCNNKHRKRHHGIFCNIPTVSPTPRRSNDDVPKNKSKKNKVKYSTDASSNSDTSDSDSSNSSTSSSEIEVTHVHKTRALKKRPILKRKVKGKVNYRALS